LKSKYFNLAKRFTYSQSKKHSVSGISCQVCENKNCLIKRNLRPDLAFDISQEKRVIRCKKGQQFILEGAPVNGLFFVLNGKAKVFRTGINGKEQIVRFASNGDIIGHRGFGTEEFYSIGAEALEDTILCYFSKEILQKALINDVTFTYDLMLFYANELNKSESKVKSLSQMTVRERVVDALLYINRKFKHRNNYLDLILSRSDYADFVGTTEEQVIRVLSALKKENLIVTHGKKIGIPDVPLLQKEIDEHNFYLHS